MAYLQVFENIGAPSYLKGKREKQIKDKKVFY